MIKTYKIITHYGQFYRKTAEDGHILWTDDVRGAWECDAENEACVVLAAICAELYESGLQLPFGLRVVS